MPGKTTRLFIAAGLVAALSLPPRAAAGPGARPSAGGRGTDCTACHLKVTPAAVEQVRASAHGEADISCVDCHGRDHDAMRAGAARVGAHTCGRCHAEAYKTHTASRHNLGLHSGWSCTRNLKRRRPGECAFCHVKGSTKPKTRLHCARFLRQSQEMRDAGCNRCHQVERSCGACHSAHMTDLRIVRDPKVCARCHMGPDHPQWEMWETSQHGQIHGKLGPKRGPTCQTCHMPAGTHDVSQGLTSDAALRVYPKKKAAAAREKMLGVCVRCHTRRRAVQDLDRSDRIRRQSLAIVKRAEEVIRDIADRGLLDPSLAERRPHPLRGRELVLDGQMLYEDISHIERLMFKMKKYDLAKTVKGAYHDNPAWTHWYGNAELKMDLVDILAEAARLKAAAAAGSGGKVSDRGGRGAGQGGQVARVEAALRLLKARAKRGKIDARTYKREKKRLLDAYEAAQAAAKRGGQRRAGQRSDQ